MLSTPEIALLVVDRNRSQKTFGEAQKYTPATFNPLVPQHTSVTTGTPTSSTSDTGKVAYSLRRGYTQLPHLGHRKEEDHRLARRCLPVETTRRSNNTHCMPKVRYNHDTREYDEAIDIIDTDRHERDQQPS